MDFFTAEEEVEDADAHDNTGESDDGQPKVMIGLC